MGTVLSTFLLSIGSKAKLFAIGGITLAAVVLAVLWRVFSAGKQSEKLASSTATLNQYKKEARIEADIRSLGADAARERLRKQWRKR